MEVNIFLAFFLSLLIIRTYQSADTNFLVEEIFVILFLPSIDMVRLFFTRLINHWIEIKKAVGFFDILLKKYGMKSL